MTAVLDVPDEFLLDLVPSRLIATSQIRGKQVTVMVQNGVVILEGPVDSTDAKDAASGLVWSTPGVRDLCNLLAVHESPG
ncbi:BON domain-containing protein [Actinoplanes sp. NBRC 103695]|uniref:BON domain-containing protein n=1 Tax=Actinoplanes sp. NBRC 103695 TaxID=3032202 RepID=UPI0024A41FEC|nr:BON domain-containing protein [Actinoplanes sp. NBRC 103695]GLZ01123.1 hypothetical protein Acsp02_83740 [Actinoplanes sp. NBRC 103695]